MFPPFWAIFRNTSLCSQVFILAESFINSGGQPSSFANSLRASRLLSMPRSFSKSTIETFQSKPEPLALFSNCLTTSTSVIGFTAAGACPGVVEGADVVDGPDGADVDGVLGLPGVV